MCSGGKKRHINCITHAENHNGRSIVCATEATHIISNMTHSFMLCNNSYTLWMLYTCSQESGGAQCHTKVFYHSVGSDDTIRSTSGGNGLYAMNEFNHYAEIASQYTEVGEEGQGEEIPVEYKNLNHAEVAMLF